MLNEKSIRENLSALIATRDQRMADATKLEESIKVAEIAAAEQAKIAEQATQEIENFILGGNDPGPAEKRETNATTLERRNRILATGLSRKLTETIRPELVAIEDEIEKLNKQLIACEQMALMKPAVEALIAAKNALRPYNEFVIKNGDRRIVFAPGAFDFAHIYSFLNTLENFRELDRLNLMFSSEA